MSLNFLQNIGLSESEIALYELLLNIGEAPVVEIVRQSKLKRPTVYKYLYSLEEKGLVTQKELKKKIHFRPEPPSKLLEFANQQYENLDRTRLDLQSMINSLTSLYVQSVERPVVKVFEGVEGLKEIYLDTLKDEKEIYAILQTEDVEPTLLKWLITSYSKKRARLKIPTKVIASSGIGSYKYSQRDKKELRTTMIIPYEKYPIAQEIVIYGDKVAFINYKKGEALIGIIIKHPQIAQTMKSFFNLAWLGGKFFE